MTLCCFVDIIKDHVDLASNIIKNVKTMEFFTIDELVRLKVIVAPKSNEIKK